MHLYALPIDEALARLNTTAEGLSEAEAARRLASFGVNEMEASAREPLWRGAARQVTHFFALILWLAAALAFVAEHYQPGQGMATLGAAILGVIVINGAFSFWQEYRAERALDALQRLLPHAVRVQRAGVVRLAPARELVPGDVVLLGAGDQVPADCRVLEAYAARVNTATVTGEALPMTVSAEPSTAAEALHARNLLLAGTALVAGEARAVVFATGMHSEFGRIAQLTQATSKGLSPLQQEITRLSRWVAALAVALGVTFFVIGQALGLPLWGNVLFAIGIIVANVPEGLLPTVTLALAMGAQRMARRRALIRHLPSVETLGSATVICTDKTGTLTENRLRAQRLHVDGNSVAVDEWTAPPDAPLLAIAAHCHALAADAAVDVAALDPLEAALIDFARERGGAPAVETLQVLPFDSERRRMAVLAQRDGERALYAKGALEALLPLCSAVRQGDAIVPLTDAARAAVLAAEAQLAADGLRVIALASRPVAPDTAPVTAVGATPEQLERDLVLAGLVALHDPPRPEVPAAIARCRSAGIRTIMVTGDHPRTALAVARQIGLANSEHSTVVSGERLARLTDTELQLLLDGPEVLFARVSAEQKRRIVAVLKRRGEIVAVTGDGVNDAPALREAHIGIAMGVAGTDVAKAAADMVLLDDNFATIVAAVEEGRGVFDNLRKFLTYILTSNIPEVVPYLAFALLRIPLPLTVIQILAVDLGTDMLPALALGAERPAAQVMQRPPRRASERLIDGALIARAYLFLGLLEAGAAMAAYFFVLHAGGWQYGQMLAPTDPLYRAATGACLAAIVLMQVANVWLCRSARGALFAGNGRPSPLLYWGIGFELLLLAAILYTPFGNALFGTAPLAMEVWWFMLPFPLAMLALEEARKAVLRWWSQVAG
ncbi:MAG TPA: cation-transporting P-type ATPase [Pseudomonadales bacterium]|nr:cation-transporting P-type ATPase [Pseudomonadales bacterium]